LQEIHIFSKSCKTLDSSHSSRNGNQVFSLPFMFFINQPINKYFFKETRNTMQIVLISDPKTTNYSDTINEKMGSIHNRVIKNIASAIKNLGHAVECIEANNELEETILRINYPSIRV